MANQSSIKCPNCGTPIDVNDILKHELEESIREEFQQKANTQAKELAAKNEELEKAKAEYQKAAVENQQYKSQSQLELNKTNRQLKDAENKVNLEKLALEQSQEAYRIRSNRFTQGLEKTTDLLQAETQMYQKELELLQAVFEYDFTQEYLQFLTK